MQQDIITVNNVSKTFPGSGGTHRTEVLKNVSLTVHKGEFLVLLGPSGCGKSTFLRILAGLEAKTSGHIRFSPDFDPKRTSFVFQNFGILPWLTVAHNVELNLLATDMPPHQRTKEVEAVIEHFGLKAAKDRYPHELSGGMRQRVGLARAFVSNPQVIFLDEPFSELDFYTASHLRAALLDMWRKNGTTVIMVSHYIDESVTLADTIAVFTDRPGTITSVVKNDLARPRDPRSAAFFQYEDEVLKHLEHHTEGPR